MSIASPRLATTLPVPLAFPAFDFPTTRRGAKAIPRTATPIWWAFVEAANFARRYSQDAKSFFDKKKAKTNSIVATKALAHKLARVSYHMLKEGRPFDVKRCFA